MSANPHITSETHFPAQIFREYVMLRHW